MRKSEIAIVGQSKTCIIPLEKIAYIHSEGDAGCFIYFLDNSSLFTTYRLNRFVEGLSFFAKCHKSYFANLAHIKELRKQEVKLINGKVLPIGKGYHNRILNKFTLI